MSLLADGRIRSPRIVRWWSPYLAVVAVSAAAMFASAPIAADYAAAKNTLETMVQELLREVRSNRALYEADDEKLLDLIRRQVLPTVDIETLSRLVLGKHWKNADEEKRRMFARSMESLLVRSYGKSLTLLLEVERVEFPAPVRPGGGRYETVMSNVLVKGNETPLRVNYVMHEVDGRWKIFDLVFDGLSLVRQFRRSFDREIGERGLAALIERLNARSR